MPRALEAIHVTVELDESQWAEHLAEQTRSGLEQHPPWIPPVWFYDERGSQLFTKITELPEYYLTGAEREILLDRASQVAEITGTETLVELGAGTSDKTRALLSAFNRAGTLRCFAPVDVSREVLEESAEAILKEFPNLRIEALVADFATALSSLTTEGVRTVAFLGSTIGNLDPQQRRAFLSQLSRSLKPGEWLLLGTDLAKDPARLIRAYNDAEGTTAQFNLNALHVLNRRVGANFNLAAFRHDAVWKPEASRMEMRLVSQLPQRVMLPGLHQMTLSLDRGEWIRTEISTKFTEDGVNRELADASFSTVEQWRDSQDQYLLTLARKR